MTEFEFDGTERFTIVRRLGAGGMGVVYEALDRERAKPVALKTLRHTDPKAIYRLKHEFRALHGIEHPNLVSLGELFEAQGRWFFTMELVSGVDILEYVGAGQGRSAGDRSAANEFRLRSTLRQLAAGLSALHSAGKVHRDVKPSNVLVTADGHVVLVDFGLIADTAREAPSGEGWLVGTAAYMAPEQVTDGQVTVSSDWYAVGVLMYEALTGELPFTGAPIQVFADKQNRPPPAPRERCAAVPADLSDLCIQLLHPNPARRPDGEELRRRFGVELLGSRYDVAAAAGEVELIGRDQELESLADVLAQVRGGCAATVTVHGESGIGKSALISRFVAEVAAADSTALVLEGRCYERETVPYKAFDGVVDALSRSLMDRPAQEVRELLPTHAALLPRVFPVLGRVGAIAEAPLEGAQVPDPHELRNRVFAALRELLAQLAQRQTLVLVIDDLQWADADSELLLHDLVCPPAPPQLLLVAATRTPVTDWGQAPAAVSGSEMGSDSIARVIELKPLQPNCAHALAQSLLLRAGASLDARPEMIAAEASGHPLYIDELVRYATDVRDAPGRRPNLQEAIWARVRQLPVSATCILQIASVAGAPLPQAVVRRAARLPVDEFSDQVARLRADHLIRTSGVLGSDEIEVYHGRVQQAVLSHLSPETRREFDQDLAGALEREPVAAERPDLLLRHLEAAGQAARAATYAVEAAHRADAALAFGRAAELYREALRLGADSWPSERSLELRISLADALASAGLGTEAADVYLEVADDAAPVVRRRCRQLAAYQLLATGHIERGISTLGALLAEIGAALPTTPRRALLSLAWTRVVLRLRGTRWSARAQDELQAADLAELDVLQVVSEGLALVDNVAGAAFQARRLRLALRLGERRRLARALGMDALFLASRGQRGLLRARQRRDAMVAIVDQSNDPELVAFSEFVDGGMHYFGGEFRGAAERFAHAEQRYRDELGSTWGLNNARLFRLFALRYMGAFKERQALFGTYVRDAVRRGDLYAATSIRRAANALWLARDKPAEARRDLHQTSWVPPEGGYHLQHWYELQALGELALYEGVSATVLQELLPRFDALERSLLTRIQIVRALSRWLRARLWLSASGSGIGTAQASHHVAGLARSLRREGIGYARAFGLLLQAAVDSCGGDTVRTLAALRRAEEAALQADLLHLATAARRRRGEYLGGDEGARQVASAEVWMRAEGIVNPERMMALIAPGFSQAAARRRALTSGDEVERTDR